MLKVSLGKIHLIKKIILVIILLPMGLMWGEVFTRLLCPQDVDPKMNIFAQDPVIGFTYLPGAEAYEKGREYKALYHINSLGLRDREYGKKKKDTVRILLLGDSFCASHGLSIESSLSRQLERAIQRLADHDGLAFRVQVVNGAAGGYSTYNYWRAYERWKAVLKPDAVVVGLSPDDFDCSNEYARYLIQGGEIMAVVKKGCDRPNIKKMSVRKIRKWLSHNSQLYVLMRNFLYYNRLVGRLILWKQAKEKRRDRQLQQYLVSQLEYISKAWLKALSHISKLKADTDADKIPLVAIPIPSKLEIDPTRLIEVLKVSGLRREDIDLNQPLKIIKKFCKDEGIPILDPRRELRRHHSIVRSYFLYDGHWNAEGVHAAAASLANQWRDLHLPPWHQVTLRRRLAPGDLCGSSTFHVDFRKWPSGAPIR